MRDGGDEAVVRVENLTTRFGDKVIHSGLSIEARANEVLAVIGASGSGKSVLLHQMVGLLTPDAGDIHVLGKRLHHLGNRESRELRRRWGILFQRGALFSALSVADNIAFPLRELRGDGEWIDEATIADLVALKLHMVGLTPEDGAKFPSELSGGMTKRAALARALALEAELLFLDEPTSGLDPVSARSFDTLLRELQSDLGLSIIMITHDLHNLAALADRVAVLADGELLAVDTLEAIAEIDHPFIHDFFRRRPGDDRLRALSIYERRD